MAHPSFIQYLPFHQGLPDSRRLERSLTFARNGHESMMSSESNIEHVEIWGLTHPSKIGCWFLAVKRITHSHTNETLNSTMHSMVQTHFVIGYHFEYIHIPFCTFLSLLNKLNSLKKKVTLLFLSSLSLWVVSCLFVCNNARTYIEFNKDTVLWKQI